MKRVNSRTSTKILLAFVMVNSLLASQLMADGPVGWWKFDEGSGTKAVDSSGKGNHGEIFGVTSWVDGYVGSGALKITGGGVKIADSPLLRPPQFTVAMWINFSAQQLAYARIFEKGNDNHETINIVGGGNRINFSILDAERSGHGLNSPKQLDVGRWYHLSAVYDGSEMSIYIDGKVANKQTVGKVVPYPSVDQPLVIGNRPPNMDRPMNAVVDDIRMYDRPLSAQEIWELYAWKGKDPHIAALPEPADGATDVLPSQSLKWMPGRDATSHHVYFGAEYDSVADGGPSSWCYHGERSGEPFDPGKLKFGRTYYWRIDEVSGGKKWKGDVWRFTVIDGKASNPSPGVMLKNVDTDAKLSWSKGSLAISHEVYFGTDADEVRKATSSSRIYKGTFALGKESYDPGPLKEGMYYYWRVDEKCKEGTAKGDVWQFRTKGGDLVLQVDLAVKTCDKKELYLGLAKPGWTIWAADAWTDMYMHDYQVFPTKADGSLDPAGINGTGVTLWMTTGSEGQLGIGAKGICRDNLGGGGCPSGTAEGDPIANSWAYGVDWVGPYAGDILLVFKGLPAGTYELLSYHNFWEPCTQKTRNCLDCDCGMPPMPSITANPLPIKQNDSNQNRSDNILKGYRATVPPGTGKGVKVIQNAYNVAPQHVYSDDELVPSVIKFATDGSGVLIIYQADRTEPLYPDCARPGREGARGILNAFELIQVSSP